MPTTFGTDPNNDLYLGMGNNIAILTGLKAVISACETATKAQLAEMVLASGLGIPNFQTIWVGTPNYALYTSYLRSTLLSVPGVQEVASLELSLKNNVLSYKATIKTDFGTGILNGG